MTRARACLFCHNPHDAFFPALLPEAVRAVYFEAAAVIVTLVLVGQVMELRAREGNMFAGVARHILEHLDAYLSASQLGITLASLGLGWIGGG